MPDDKLWDLKPATEAKHRLYKRYLSEWWPKLLLPSRIGRYSQKRVTYLDAFAGPGEYTAGEPGSPVFTLDDLLHHDFVQRMRLSRERVHLLFMEKRQDRFDHLQGRLDHCFGPLDKLPVLVKPVQRDAGEATEKLLTETGAWGHPILAVFDSWGSVNVPFRTIQRLADNRSSEVIVTFGPNWFSRRNQVDLEKLDRVFGGRQYWEPADRELSTGEQWRVWLETYRKALHRAGFQYQLDFRIVPKSGHPLDLVYGTRHPSGVQSMKNAMWDVDPDGGTSFADPRTRRARPLGMEPMFWTGSDHPELWEFARQRLEQGPVTIERLGIWLLTETSRWREKDAMPAVKVLIDQGIANTSTPGRLSKRSVITLR